MVLCLCPCVVRSAWCALNRNAAPQWPVYITGLPPEADEALLYKLFGPFGAILSVKAMRDPGQKHCKVHPYAAWNHCLVFFFFLFYVV